MELLFFINYKSFYITAHFFHLLISVACGTDYHSIKPLGHSNPITTSLIVMQPTVKYLKFNCFNCCRMKRKYYSWDEAMNLREVKVLFMHV